MVSINPNLLRCQLACDDSNSETFGPIVVWSAKDDSNWVFHPVGPPRSSATVKPKMRPNLSMAQESGACRIRAAIRTTNDGVTFETPVAIGSVECTADGAQYGGSYTDLSTNLNAKRLVQIGIQCINQSGTSLEMCAASLQLDFSS